MKVHHTLLLTVVGPLLAAASDRGLLRLSFLPESYVYRTEVKRMARTLSGEIGLREDPAPFNRLVTQLGEYFSGRRQEFDLPLDLQGSRFQLAVWEQILRIPFGKTSSFRQIARRIGRPAATRAVGQAVGHNPLIIVVPCHRVVGSDGKLVGFGAGVTVKAQLLRLEGHTLGKTPRLVAPQLF